MRGVETLALLARDTCAWRATGEILRRPVGTSGAQKARYAPPLEARGKQDTHPRRMRREVLRLACPATAGRNGRQALLAQDAYGRRVTGEILRRPAPQDAHPRRMRG